MRISYRQVLLAASAAMLLTATAASEARAALTLAQTGGAATGAQDPNYHLISAPAGTPTPLSALVASDTQAASTGWLSTGLGGAHWISPVNPTAGTSLPTGFSGGTYTPFVFEGQSFTGASVGGTGTFSATLNVTLGADDTTSIILHNATTNSDTVLKTATPGTFQYTSLTSSSFGISLVAADTYTLRFGVINTGNPTETGTTDGPIGLLVTAAIVTAVPEPSTLALAISGGVFGLATVVRRRRRSAV